MADKAFEPTGIMGPQIFGLPVDRETLFSNHKKIYKKRIENRQRNFIVKLPFLKPFLKTGEKILLVSTGYSPITSLPQYVTGFLFVYLKRSLFVFTNHRIFHVPTTPNYKFKQSLSQIYYAGCQSIELKGGTLVVQYAKSGKIEKFKAMALSERKKIRALLKQKPFSGTKSQVGERFHLCPQCTRLLTAAKYVCESCGLKFKNKIFLLVYIAVILQDVLNGVEGNMGKMLVLSAIFAAVKIISVIHSTHFVNEFIPRKKEVQANPAAAKAKNSA